MHASKLLLVAFCMSILLHAPAARGTEPVTIRVAWIAPLTNWASLLLEKKELAQHLGRSYLFEPVRFVGTPQMVTALANGELEIANLAFSTLPIAIENAGLEDLRVIADELQDGVDDYYSQEYMVLADGPVKTIEDLKGKVVATVAAGAAVDVAIKTMLRKHGLVDKRDYTMVEAPLPTMRAMLADKKVDLVPVVLPFALDPELRRNVAKRVNDALLDGLVDTGADGMVGNGRGTVGAEDIERVRGLLRLIQWGEQTIKDERIVVPTLDVKQGTWEEPKTNGHSL